MRRLTAKQVILFLLGLLVILIGALVWLELNRRAALAATLTEVFIDETYGVTIRYPHSFLPREISEEYQKNGYRLRVDQLEPPGFVFLKVEEGGRGLGTVSALGGVSRLEVLKRNTEKTLPTLMKNYQLERVDEIRLANTAGLVFLFTYDGPSGERVKQRFTEVLRDGRLIYTIISQARVAEFDMLLPTFEAIERSLEFTPLPAPAQTEEAAND